MYLEKPVSNVASYLAETVFMDGESVEAYHQRVVRVAVNVEEWQDKAKVRDEFTYALNHGFAYSGNARGILNLSAFVDPNSTLRGTFNFDRMRKVVKSAIRLIDNFHIRLDMPFDAQPLLAVCGISDALMMLGHNYDCREARAVAQDIVHALREYTFDAAIELAAERGPHAEFNTDRYLRSGYGRCLSSEVQSDIRRTGLRHEAYLYISGSAAAAACFFQASPGLMPHPQWEYEYSFHNKSGQLKMVKILSALHTHAGGFLTHQYQTLPQISYQAYATLCNKVENYFDGGVTTLPVTFLNMFKPEAAVIAFPSRLFGRDADRYVQEKRA